MSFLSNLMGGGGNDTPSSVNTTPAQQQSFLTALQGQAQHLAVGGTVDPNAVTPTTPQAAPMSGTNIDANGVLTNGSNTIFNAHPGQTGGQVWSNTVNDIPGANAINPALAPVANIAGQAGQSISHGLGDTFQGIGSAFTAQNQYQAQLAPTTNLDYTGVINQSAGNALNGYGQFAQNQAQQQALNSQLQNTGNQYQALANGTGPNPAQAALNQNTGANVANQAALMAGQRGAGANVGLMARQAAMQGANTQQQAVGQGATLQSQQQLAGLSGLQANQQAQAGLLGQMGSNIQGEQGVNNNLFGSATGANTAQNNTSVANAGMAQGINSQVAQNNANAVNKTTSGLMGGVASLLNQGGKVKKMADGGDPGQSTPDAAPQSPMDKMGSSLGNSFGSAGNGNVPMGVIHSQYAPDLSYNGGPQAAQQAPGPKSNAGKYLQAKKNGTPAPSNAPTPMAGDPAPQPMPMQQPQVMMASKGGKVPAMLSPGEKYLTPKEAKAVAHGAISPEKVGKIVPGVAKVKGDSLKNDVIPATLEEGGCVIPRSKMNNMSDAIKFVHAHMSKSKALAKGKK